MLEISTTKAHFNGETINAVNARELHKLLESKQDFSTWIKKRISNANSLRVLILSHSTKRWSEKLAHQVASNT